MATPGDDIAAAVAAATRLDDRAERATAIAAAIRAIRPEDVEQFVHRQLDIADDVEPIGSGLPASPGAAAGRVALTADAAIEAAASGDTVILVRPETTPDDVLGMQSAAGILTMRGGLASHAAVVARGWGIPAVVGATDVHIDGDRVTIGTTTLAAGEEITVDGSTGAVYRGRHATTTGEAPPELDTLLAWADAVADGHVEVRANADTASDATQARELGARGIGLCRTEHMFLAADRLPLVRRFILTDDAEVERTALDELERAQEHDFEALLEAMDDLPVTVRLLDPPLHEFLPDLTDLVAREARGELGDDEAIELAAARRLHESNPMIGTRGVRLGVVRPGLYEMQVRALCTAAARLLERGRRPRVEVMIPLVVDAAELALARGWVTDTLNELGHPELAADVVVVGAMVETPRAAVTAAALAEHADFFSFGTNDLTQLTYAFSRDDVEAKLMPAYLGHGILSANPFAELDREGVGELVRLACEGARRAKPGIKLGVCGEHAGDPGSISFLVGLGVDSVSCSPYRVPVARHAVAQALLDSGRVEIGDVDFGAVDHRAAGQPGAADPSVTDTTSESGAPNADATGPSVEVTEAVVLHVLRVRGFVTSSGFEASLGTVPTEILADLVECGAVRHMEARDMYGLMPDGKERHAAVLADIVGDDTAALAAPYERFLELNTEFKQLCTDWQVRGDEPNDHTDAAYDGERTTELRNLCDRAASVIDDLGGAHTRLARYRPRLAEAADAVERGETKRFTGVMCESFHDIWMELHEDLIVLQGIDRTAEGSF